MIMWEQPVSFMQWIWTGNVGCGNVGQQMPLWCWGLLKMKRISIKSGLI
jgi:hypothetical protein